MLIKGDKIMSLNRTTIETADFTWNPITVGSYADNLEKCSLDSFCPRFHPERLHIEFPDHGQSKNPHLEDGQFMTFVMGDIYDQGVDWIWRAKVFERINKTPKQVFQILTKFPWKLSGMYMNNTWIGASAISQNMAEASVIALRHVDAPVKYISFEPLLSSIHIPLDGIDWIIIGAQTEPLRILKNEWINQILNSADKSGTKVFIKNSIGQMMQFYGDNVRREFPILKT